MLVTIGAVVTPVLFATLTDRHLAGVLAGSLFRVATVGSAALAAVLVMLESATATRARLAAAVGPAIILSVSEWLVRPLLEAARAAATGAAFAAWHALSTLLYAGATAWVVASLIRELRA